MRRFNHRKRGDTVCLECLRPGQIVKRREEFPAIYIAVGPLEWHSWQNPFGTDGMRGHLLLVEVALLAGGIVMPPIYMGTDAERTPEERKQWKERMI